MRGLRLIFLYDGACAICAAEAARLARRNRSRGTLRFIDISTPGFDPARYGKTIDELMGRVHAFRPDGTVLVAMDAVHAAYDEVGLGWLLLPTRWPGLRGVFDCVYLWFARNRYRIGGMAKCGRERCTP